MRGVIVLTRTMGDVILGNVLVNNIKLDRPDLELDYIVEEKYQEIVQNNPNIKNTITVKDTVNEWDDILVRIAKYDKVYLPQQTAPEDNFWHQRDKFRFGNLVDFYAYRCDIELKDRTLKWYPCVSEVIKGLDEGSGVFCHTTTLGDSKNWSKFTILKNRLNKMDVIVYQVGLKDDISIGVEEKYDLRGLYSLGDLAFIMKNFCDCFIGLDSGLSFIAAAVGVPTICIMGASVPRTSSPWGDNVIHLIKENNCKDRRERCHALFGKCRLNQKCIDKVEVVDVLKEFERIIKV